MGLLAALHHDEPASRDVNTRQHPESHKKKNEMNLFNSKTAVQRISITLQEMACLCSFKCLLHSFLSHLYFSATHPKKAAAKGELCTTSRNGVDHCMKNKQRKAP